MLEVSILLPVYNGMPYVKDAIGSVLRQKDVNFELLVSDDASTDETSSFLQGLTDPRIRLVRHEKNLGATPNWNYALSMARAEFCLLLCADDVLRDGALRRMLDSLERQSSNVHLVSGQRCVIDRAGKVLVPRIGIGALSEYHLGAEAIRLVMRSGRNLIGEPSAVLFRRSVAQDLGGFQSTYKFCPDLDLWIRILEKGDFFGIPEVIADFRVSPSSGSVGMAKIQRSQGIAFWRDVSKRNTSVSKFDYWIGLLKLNLAVILRRLVYRRTR